MLRKYCSKAAKITTALRLVSKLIQNSFDECYDARIVCQVSKVMCCSSRGMQKIYSSTLSSSCRWAGEGNVKNIDLQVTAIQQTSRAWRSH